MHPICKKCPYGHCLSRLPTGLAIFISSCSSCRERQETLLYSDLLWKVFFLFLRESYEERLSIIIKWVLLTMQSDQLFPACQIFLPKYGCRCFFYCLSLYFRVSTCIDFCSCNGRMAKEIPDIYKVDTTFQQMHAFTVAQCVRRHSIFRWHLIIRSPAFIETIWQWVWSVLL